MDIQVTRTYVIKGTSDTFTIESSIDPNTFFGYNHSTKAKESHTADELMETEMQGSYQRIIPAFDETFGMRESDFDNRPPAKAVWRRITAEESARARRLHPHYPWGFRSKNTSV